MGAAGDASGRPSMSGQWIETAVVRLSTVGISDPDGILSTTYEYEWLRCDSNGSNCNTVIGSANTYTLTSDEAGLRLRLRVSFEDAAGNDESVVSYPWPARNRSTIQAYPACTESDLTAFPGRKMILTTTMTVGHFDGLASDKYGYTVFSGVRYGSLSEDDFVFAGNRWTLHKLDGEVAKFAGGSSDGDLTMGIIDTDTNVPVVLRANARNNLRLHVCNRTFNLNEADYVLGLSSPLWTANEPFVANSTRIIRLSQPASTDATLSALALSSGTLDPTFDTDTTSYIVADASGTRITVTPTTTHNAATVEYLDAADTALTDADTSSADTFEVDLGTDDTVIKVKVIAEDETTTKTYIVTVKGASTDATLSTLTVSPGTLDPAFDAATTSYRVSVGSDVTRVSITVTTNDAKATLKYLDATDTELTDADTASTDSFEVDVVTGDNVIKMKVTAENGSTTETYSVTVRRLSADATLSALTVTPGTLTPAFASATTSYAVGYAASVSRVTVTPTTTHAGASVEYLDATDSVLTDAETTSTDTFEVDLGSADTVIKIKVTAEDGTTTRIYTLTVEGPSDEASLSNLTLNPGTLSPAFTSGTTSYSANVGTETTRTTVTPTTTHDAATVEYLDAADATLTDADTSSTDTFEVDLEIGENVVKVKVTAENGTSTRTYTVLVQRGATLRLVNGSVDNEGRLEMFYAGKWGTICDDYWTEDDADVACRVLGYEESEGNADKYRRAYFGAGTGPIHLDNLRCTGSERSLLDCPRHNDLAVGDHNCSHKEDVGVRCSVGSSRIASAPTLSESGADGQWGPGESLKVTVTFTEAVQVSTNGGTPSIEVRLGESIKRRATYTSGSGTDELMFTYTLQSDDGTHATVHVSGDSLQLNGGQIRSRASGRDTLLDHAGASRAGEAGTTPPLTASFESVPSSHDGPGDRFKFELHFSHEIPMSYRTVAGDLLTMRAKIDRARRLTQGSNTGWEVTVSPTSFDDIVITLPATADCSSPTAVCTSSGQKLETGISTLVPGLPGVAVADAEVEEAEGATLDFVVTISRAPTRLEAVRYQTVDGTARAGRDYVAKAGIVVFPPGVRTRTVSISIIDDSHDEGDETMRLMLSEVANGATTEIRIADRTAIGTITNTDPMPKAWMVRFGRTVGTQLVDAVTDQIDGRKGSEVTLAGLTLTGRALSVPAHEPDESIGLPVWPTDGSPALATSTFTYRDLVHRSRFLVKRRTRDESEPLFSAWGRAVTSGFGGEMADLAMTGDVTTGLIGADAEWESMIVGVVLSQSVGSGTYRRDAKEREDYGSVESILTGTYPYLRIDLNRRMSTWALAGAGSGELTLNQAGQHAMPTDLSMRMGAMGMRGRLLEEANPSNMSFNVKADAMWVSTRSADTDELASTEGDVSRIRLMLQGGRTIESDSGSRFTPSGEVSLRHDGGDAETGTGVEVGAGVSYSVGALTIVGRGRALVVHEISNHREWGASGAIHLNPGTSGHGLSFSIASEWGRINSTSERFWSNSNVSTLRTLASDPELAKRTAIHAGYGITRGPGRGVLTPYFGLIFLDESSLMKSIGANWSLGANVSVEFEAARSERRSVESSQEVNLRASLLF